MFEVNCYIHPNDRLNLTNTPIGPTRMDHKITKAKIKQMRISFGIVHKKYSKRLSLSCHDWVVAGKSIQRKKAQEISRPIAVIKRVTGQKSDNKPHMCD